MNLKGQTLSIFFFISTLISITLSSRSRTENMGSGWKLFKGTACKKLHTYGITFQHKKKSKKGQPMESSNANHQEVVKGTVKSSALVNFLQGFHTIIYNKPKELQSNEWRYEKLNLVLGTQYSTHARMCYVNHAVPTKVPQNTSAVVPNCCCTINKNLKI